MPGTIAAPSWLAFTIIAVVALMRLAEIVYSRRNQQRLLAAGGREVGARHYSALIAVHVCWLAGLVMWAMIFPVRLNLIFLAAFIALQPLRLWIVASLGRYWTTRIITLPGAPLVRNGPYRYMRHPNYMLVVLEVALLPLALGAWPLALAFSVMNAVMLAVRVSTENAALLDRRQSVPPGA